MSHISGEGNSDYQVIGNAETGYLIYTHTDGDIALNIKAGKYALHEVNIKTGKVDTIKKSESTNGKYTISGKGSNKVYWLERL